MDKQGDAILELAHVAKRFGERKAVDDLSLRIGAGQVYALLGPNGAGKTTTLNLILGFLAADAGRVSVDGFDVTRDPMRARATIAYLTETVMLNPTLSGIENLRYFALLCGHHIDAAKARDLLSSAGLQADAHARRAEGYSKGMRQKVGLAIALAKHARLLLLDEPTSGLDASAANDFSRVVRLASSRGMAVLMATHDLYRVVDAADRIGILHDGRLRLERGVEGLCAASLESLYLDQLARAQRAQEPQAA